MMVSCCLAVGRCQLEGTPFLTDLNMAKKYIDTEKLKAETERLWDEYDGKELSERNEGAIEAIDRIESFIDSLQQEQPCNTCTNDKGCVTCKDGELWEGKEQPSEDLEAEKDLALTWEDMRQIDQIISDVLCSGKESTQDSEKGRYEEILHRFLEWRGKNE